MFKFSCLFILIFSSILTVFSQNYDYRDADKLFNEEKWAEAGEVFLKLAENNPYQGYFLDNYAYCLYKQKNYTKAIEYFKKAIQVGYRINSCMYNIACCYSLLNNAEESVNWIKQSALYKYSNLEQNVIGDEDFNTVRNSEIFKEEIIPSKDMFKNRLNGWETDIKFMKKRMEQTHYDLFANISKTEWDIEFESLLNKIDKLDDSQVYTELQKIAAKVGDGHTSLMFSSGEKFKVHILPLLFFSYEDGIFITMTSPEYKELAGKKVLGIGKYSIEDAIKITTEAASVDNDFNLRSINMHLLTLNDILYGLGITGKNDEADITIEGNKKISVKSFLPQGNYFHNPDTRKDWVKGRDTTVQPMYLKNRQDLYWYEYLPDEKMVYMQYNAVANKDNDPLSGFVKRMFGFIDSNDVEFFVLDIRYNGGGNSFLNKSLVQGIIKCDRINRKGKFFTIIGRHTFSAAMNLACDIERQTNVIFAGEPTGSKPNFVGESNMILLPYSGLRVSCSSRYWQGNLSDDYRKWIAPHLGVKYFYSDYKNGIDPAMDAILKFINKK